MEMFSKQTQELTGLGQKLASKSAAPVPGRGATTAGSSKRSTCGNHDA
jgi:hypothetical protein